MSQNYHYYVSHGLGYKIAETLSEAMEGAFCTSAFGDMGAWLRNIQKDGGAGIPCFTCRVPLPMSSSYEIEWFVPQVEGLTERQNRIVTYVTKKKLAWMVDPADEIRQLQHELDLKEAELQELL